MHNIFSGNINEDLLRELLTTMGDRFTDEEVCIHNEAYQHVHFFNSAMLSSGINNFKTDNY